MIIINNNGDITMRKSEEIRADIEKLTKELEVAKIHEAKQSAAVHILYNLGWKHDQHKGWQKPEPKRDWKEFDKDAMSHIKVGDWVRVDTGFTGFIGLVRAVHGNVAHVSKVLHATPREAKAATTASWLATKHLTVISQTDVWTSFI